MRAEGERVVTWTKIPIIGLPELACAVPVDIHGDALDGDGEPLPLEDRREKCGADGVWMIGMVSVCARHFPQVAEMCGDSAEAITIAWRETLGFAPQPPLARDPEWPLVEEC